MGAEFAAAARVSVGADPVGADVEREFEARPLVHVAGAELASLVSGVGAVVDSMAGDARLAVDAGCWIVASVVGWVCGW